METIHGIVVRILKRNEETGNVFMTVQYDSSGGLVQAKLGGLARDLTEGDWFSAEGEWRSSVHRGRTEEIFNARMIRPDLPMTPSGAMAFLSRAFTTARHGISSAAIGALIKKHGAAVAHAAEDNTEILVSASTNPAAYRNAIVRDWKRRVAGRKAIVLLEKAGVERRAIDRIMSAFQDKTHEVMTSNPYKAAPLPSVGFKNADRVGTLLRVPPTDDRRLAAALTEVLAEERTAGGTYASIGRILEGLASRTGVASDAIRNFLLRAVSTDMRDEPFIVDILNGSSLIAQSPDLLRAEASIAKAVVRLLDHGRRNDRKLVEAAAERLFRKEKYARFDETQRRAVIMAVSEPISILTGGPGTGKSTVMEAVAELSAELDNGPLFLAGPTGMASKRLAATTGRDAQTIHRLLRARRTATGESSFAVNAEQPLPERASVVVDEGSMVDAMTTAALFDALPPDGRILFVGDRNQLPSVGAGQVLADLLAAKTAEDRWVVPAVELITVYRQKKDSAIATGAAEIREGRMPEMDDKVRGGVVLYEHAPNEICDKVLSLVTGPIQKQLGFDPIRDVAIVAPQAPGVAGTWEINRRMASTLNPAGRAIEGISHGPDDDRRMPLPKIGDRVMLTENDDENGLVNGDIGILIDAYERVVGSSRRRFLAVEFDCGKRAEYPISKWRSLIVAYAGTVHKIQGSQAPVVIMPVTMAHQNMLDRTLLYTGWTRAQKLLILVGEREAIQHAIDTMRTSERNTRLREFTERFARDLGLEGTLRVAPAVAPPAVQPADTVAERIAPAPAPSAQARAVRPMPLPGVMRPRPLPSPVRPQPAPPPSPPKPAASPPHAGGSTPARYSGLTPRPIRILRPEPAEGPPKVPAPGMA